MTTLSKKICLLGDFAVGKTSLVRRFVYNLFDDKYMSTIGVKVSRKTVAVYRNDEVVDVTMMLWDLAGSEKFDQIQASYMRGAAGALLVCDLTRPETLNPLQKYADDISGLRPNPQLIVVANKSDLVDRQDLDPAEVEAMAAKLNIPFYLTSAKTGDNVEMLFRHLGRLLVT